MPVIGWVPFDAYYTIGAPISLGQSMKPGIYATKKAIALITIAMVRMIRSSLVIPANMTQDGSISLEYTVPSDAHTLQSPTTEPSDLYAGQSG